MKVELIDYTEDGINKIATLARSTRLNKFDDSEPEDYCDLIPLENGNYEMKVTDEYREWQKKNENFVRNLIKVQHLGVLEHINFTFHVSEISRCLTHQLVRHRIGFSYLQMSNRHAKPDMNDFVIPKHKNPDVEAVFKTNLYEAYNNYCHLIDELGVPIEDARYVLPPAFFTHISFTVNARSLRHFLELRLAKGAQWEIRELACKLFDEVYKWYPILFEDLLPLRLQNSELTVDFDITKSHKEGDITVVDELDLKSISIKSKDLKELRDNADV